MSNMELVDLEFSGLKFTWKGNRCSDVVQERLDKGLVNGSWQVRWLETSVIHGTIRGSDHCPIIVITENSREMRKKIFRFEAFWAKDEGCREVVERSWNRRVGGRRVERWLHHQDSCRGSLMRWSKSRFQSAQVEIDFLFARLGHIQG